MTNPSYEELVRTLEAYAANRMMNDKAAHELNVRRKTIAARLDRIERMTGLNPRNFYDLHRILQNKEVLWQCDPTRI